MEPGADQWRSRGACAAADPEIFFPAGSSSAVVVQTDRAKRICESCDVVETCLWWAMVTAQPHGIWGGLTERERREMA
ncbi:WhiB family transcriptional regulator [Actinomycetota bacterium Odt1-20B]